jgi:hypothetical protein
LGHRLGRCLRRERHSGPRWSRPAF